MGSLWLLNAFFLNLTSSENHIGCPSPWSETTFSFRDNFRADMFHQPIQQQPCQHFANCLQKSDTTVMITFRFGYLAFENGHKDTINPVLRYWEFPFRERVNMFWIEDSMLSLPCCRSSTGMPSNPEAFPGFIRLSAIRPSLIVGSGPWGE